MAAKGVSTLASGGVCWLAEAHHPHDLLSLLLCPPYGVQTAEEVRQPVRTWRLSSVDTVDTDAGDRNDGPITAAATAGDQGQGGLISRSLFTSTASGTLWLPGALWPGV